MAACVRLLALLLAVVCLSASTHTGNWRGPLDIAGVGEGHSRLPDRPHEELIDRIGAVDDVCGVLPEQCRELPAVGVDVGIGVGVGASWVCVDARHVGSPRGPPAA